MDLYEAISALNNMTPLDSKRINESYFETLEDSRKEAVVKEIISNFIKTDGKRYASTPNKLELVAVDKGYFNKANRDSDALVKFHSVGTGRKDFMSKTPRLDSFVSTLDSFLREQGWRVNSSMTEDDPVKRTGEKTSDGDALFEADVYVYLYAGGWAKEKEEAAERERAEKEKEKERREYKVDKDANLAHNREAAKEFIEKEKQHEEDMKWRPDGDENLRKNREEANRQSASDAYREWNY